MMMMDNDYRFLPRDATQSAVMRLYVCDV